MSAERGFSILSTIRKKIFKLFIHFLSLNISDHIINLGNYFNGTKDKDERLFQLRSEPIIHDRDRFTSSAYTTEIPEKRYRQKQNIRNFQSCSHMVRNNNLNRYFNLNRNNLNRNNILNRWTRRYPLTM